MVPPKEMEGVVTVWLRQRLHTLGDKSSSIVETLTKENIKGIPEDPSCCPIARYVEADRASLHDLDIKPHYFRVDVEPDDPEEVDFENWCVRIHLDDHKVSMDLPKCLARFAYDFDHNEYPTLVDPAYLDSQEERTRDWDEFDHLDDLSPESDDE